MRYNKTSMTQISTDDVQHLAQLSSLQLDEAEVESLRTDLENIVGYIEQLSELDTTGVEPTYQVTDLQNVWREDAVDDYGISKEELLALAPAAEAHQIKVPKVL
jgi:aspartyl-tRNA(Asn)/glutamyl-tRNA(Gln) amidotransferase subunit C